MNRRKRFILTKKLFVQYSTNLYYNMNFIPVPTYCHLFLPINKAPAGQIETPMEEVRSMMEKRCKGEKEEVKA